MNQEQKPDNDLNNIAPLQDFDTENKKTYRPIVVGVFLVLVLIVIVALLQFRETEMSILEQIQNVSDSDEIEDIMKDIEATDIDILHADFEDANKRLIENQQDLGESMGPEWHNL